MTRLLLRLAAYAAVAAALSCPVAAATRADSPPREPKPVVVQPTRSGFDWGDAAIGAAAALGLVLAVTGALVLKGDRNAR
jgi:hypothetical protein